MAGTHFRGPLSIIKPDGSFVVIADEDGNIDAPVTTTNLTTTGNTTLGNATSDTLTVNGNSTFTGTADGVMVDVVVAAITTGTGLDLSANTALTTGILAHISSAATAITGAGRLFYSNHTGVSSTSGILNEFASAAADETVIVRVTASAALAAGVALDLVGASVTTGTMLDVSGLDALTTGIGITVSSAATAITGVGRLFYSNHSGATSTSGILNEFASAANDETVIVKITSSAALALGTALQVSGVSITTGTAISANDLNALTTGLGLHVASSATAITGVGRLFFSNHTGATSTSGILNEFASAANDETVIVQIKSTAALALGKMLNLSGAAITTGKLFSADDADALTTGSIVSLTSNSADATARSLAYIKNDHASATGAFCLELVNDSTGSPIKTTAGAVSTNYFRVGTFNGVTLWVGNGTTANGNLSGTAGDVIFNAGTNKPEYCTGTTNWTALV